MSERARACAHGCPHPVRSPVARSGTSRKEEPRQHTTRGGGAVAATVRWAGKEAAPCLQGDQLGPRIEFTEFLELFNTQPALPAGSQPIWLWRRILARLPRFRSSETPAAPGSRG